MVLDGKYLGEYQSILVNGSIIVQRGKIANNPFLNRLDYSKTAQWMVENKGEVMRSLAYFVKLFGLSNYGANVEDCFDYALWYFTKDKSKAFNKDYFGENTNYDVRNYCISNLKYVVSAYRNELKKTATVSLGTNDEAERYSNTIIEDNYDLSEGTLSVEEMIEYKDFERFDVEFSWLEDYLFYFQRKNYKKFDILGYLTHMYFDVHKDDYEEHIKYVANKIGESEELIHLVTENFKKDVKNNDDVALDILKFIGDLIQNMKMGWLPKKLREDKVKV